jgi:hypothetical protein
LSESPRSSVLIAVAVIAAIGTIIAAAIGSWDHLFPPIQTPPGAESSPKSEAPPLADSNGLVSEPLSDPEEAEAAATHRKSANGQTNGRETQASLIIDGRWTDTDGAELWFVQTGSRYTFTTHQGGRVIGTGSGIN